MPHPKQIRVSPDAVPKTQSHTIALRDSTKQFTLKDKFPLLILLTGLIRLVILPAHTLIALLAVDVPHNVSPGSHIPLRCLACPCVDHRAEEVCLAMLATEVPGDDIVLGGEMGFAGLAAEDLGRVEVNVVGETHG